MPSLLLGGEELMITKIGQDRYYKKLFFPTGNSIL